MTPPKFVVAEGIAPRNCDHFYCPIQFLPQVISAQNPILPHRRFKDISPGVQLDNRVEKYIQMMREDVRGELSLGEFAQSVNLSVWRLCHIFKSDVGMPPIRYLRLLRMERAKGLLESSFLSVKEIAY